MKELDLLNYCLSIDKTINDAIRLMEKNSAGIVLVVDEERHLLGTITDGDIRRGFLERVNLEASVTRLLKRKEDSPHQQPLVANLHTSASELLTLLQRHSLRHIPLLDELGKVCDLVFLSELIKDEEQPIKAVVMAGGSGMRLRPLTENMPKPMLPVGDKPLMERMITQIKNSGINNIFVTTHYLPEKIYDYFGSGQNFGVDLNYLSEDEPLGTAGSLCLLGAQADPLLVINGDILTNMNFRTMIDYHKNQKATITIGVRLLDIPISYGVVETDINHQVTQIIEKPTHTLFINAGIYIIEPSALNLIPKKIRFDMPELIKKIIEADGRVFSFPIHEYWLDIGRNEDYSRAQLDIAAGVFSE